MSQTEDVILALGNAVSDLETRIARQEELLQFLSKCLSLSFKEMGFDFDKIARKEFDRQEDSQNIIIGEDGPEVDPAIQDEIAKRILQNEPNKDGNKDGDVCPV